MPADYSSTAQALSLPISPSPSPSPNAASGPTDGPSPPWVRSTPRRSSDGVNAQRLSTPYSRATGDDRPKPFGRRIMQASVSAMNNLLKLYYNLTPTQQILFSVVGLVIFALTIVFLVYSHRIFAALGPVAESWRALPGGWVLVFLMTCVTAFPPMIGYSTTITIAGFVYGFPGGWPIVAAATVVGSAGAFLASRTVLSGYVHRLVGADKRFVALGQVLRHDGIFMLAGIRFCPLPYSLSNGFLATIPSISPMSFALATAMATPKLLVHVFIGSRLALLGDDMSLGDKVINYLSMVIGSVVGIAIGLIIYRRTMARAKQLARDDAAEHGVIVDDTDDLTYEDLEEGILHNQRSEDADAAALMDDDDLSLWDNDGLDDFYRDEENNRETGGHTDENGSKTNST
ncbi:hypothetical protein F4778DRAFT_118315 [Xylariomycetidae sp. FL2044]|nr:hypothetical protein F4778DRAFT_118315 [Xylariomycetidae sp. FL2044]